MATSNRRVYLPSEKLQKEFVALDVSTILNISCSDNAIPNMDVFSESDMLRLNSHSPSRSPLKILTNFFHFVFRMLSFLDRTILFQLAFRRDRASAGFDRIASPRSGSDHA